MIYKNKKQKRPKKKLILIIVAALLLLAATVAALELTDTTNFFHKKPDPQTSNQYTKGEPHTNQPKKDNSQTPDEDNTATDDKGQSDTPITPQTKLIAPSGNFASAHKFSLASNPPIGSTCETTPKVNCQIIFTNGNKTVELTKQTTDAGGATYWTWKPKDIGLTTGTWKIQAKATQGIETLTASDALNLEITP